MEATELQNKQKNVQSKQKLYFHAVVVIAVENILQIILTNTVES